MSKEERIYKKIGQATIFIGLATIYAMIFICWAVK